MKLLHRPDLFGWSRFDESRNLDFCSVAWVRPGGNVLIDPLAMSEHDRAHLEALVVGRIVREHPEVETVLVGDGWPVFHEGQRALAALCDL